MTPKQESMSDLTKRLREMAGGNEAHYCYEAADRIEQLERDLAAAPAPEDARDAPHIAPFRLLVAACNRLSAEAEEYTFDDGMGRGALQDYWDEFEAALERARESLND